MNKVDVLEHVGLNSEGILEWTEATQQEARAALAHYFAARKEDG